jgi:RND family efflux transporter MFP subunit
MSVAALQRAVVRRPDDRSDEDLLRVFRADRDEGAFGIIVRRHGGLVFDVCRTILRNDADAEDAFQATFVALAADAHRVRCPAALAGWLHAVACRTAAKARRSRERRRLREARVTLRPETAEFDPSWAEVRQTIHEEVNSLPDRYRAAIVLYYLAGRTQDEVGQALGLSTAGVKKRLERGRALLQSALLRRGFGPTASLAVAAIALPAATAALTTSTAELAIRYVTNNGALPAAVRSLLCTGVQTMSAKIAVGAVVLLGVATTVGIGMSRGGPPDPAKEGDEPALLAQAKQKAPPTRGVDDPLPPRKSQPTSELDLFRGLDPAERLKMIEKFAGAKSPYTAVTRGDLAVTVIERGSIEAANTFDVVCKVKAKDKDSAATTIKWLIDEGSSVKKGDVLVQLDDSAIREQLEMATAKAKEAEATLALATDSIRLMQEGHDVDIRLAEIDVKLAAVELKNAEFPKEKELWELKVEQAKLRLDRVRFQAKAQVMQAEAEKRVRMAAYEGEAQRRNNLRTELEQCVLTAPADGLAVYYAPPAGRFSGMPIVAVGEPVREGQKLVRIADLKKFTLATRVHESVISTFRAGQIAQVQIDAFPGKTLQGKVTQISPVASAAEWTTKNIKVYPVTISIEDAPAGLKPGMTGVAEIVTGERKSALQLPLKAVMGSGLDRHCFVKSGQEIVDRKVITGAANANSIEILEGLKEGDEVIVDLPALLRRK